MGYMCLFELWFSQGWEDPLEKEMATHSSTIAWKIHGRRTPWTPWGRKESDMIERLHFHFLFSEYMPKSEFAGSYGSFIPNFLRKLCTVLQASQVVLVVKNHLPMQETGDAGLIPVSGRFPGGGHSNPLQYSYLENPMDRGAGGLHPQSHIVGHN